MRLVESLTEAVGPRHVLAEPDLTAPFETDWTGRFSGRADVVVRPADADEVAAVLRICAAERVAVIPQGGNTGLVGGGVPRPLGASVASGVPTAPEPTFTATVVVSTTRLTTLGEVDPALGQVTVGAGVTLADLQAHAAAAGLDAALDFAARDSCTVGGAVACDAGGGRALRHGTARARVVGLEAVLADGRRISRLGGLAKDNAGLDLGALLVGSEGTLGVITAVRWQLEPALPERAAVLFGVPSATAAADTLAVLRGRVPELEACDFFTDAGLDLALAHQRRADPFAARAPLYLLVEAAGTASPLESLADALEAAGIQDTLVADDTAQRRRLWALREGLADAVNAAGVPHKLDVGVPLDRLGAFLDRVEGVVTDAAPGARTVLWGHLGDGNVHVNVLGAGGADLDDEAPDDAVLALVLELGGTISAEHGVGVAKARWLERARGADELTAMRAVKRALDPEGTLNPGAVLEWRCSQTDTGRPA